MEPSSSRLEELQRTFVAPRPLMQSRPRDVTLTGAGRALVTIAMLLLAAAVGVGLAMHGEAQRQASNRRALVEDGVFATSEVTRLWSSGDDRRRVEYRFVVDGRPYSARARVSAERRRTLQVGSPLPVRYVPADPRLNDLGGTPRGGLPVWLSVVTAGGIGGAGLLCLLVIARQRRLLTDGHVAPAIVTAHHRQRSQHGTHRSLTFQFPLLSGRVASGKSGTSSKPPDVGSVICVVYDPDRPSRNRVYPLALVKPAH